MTHDGPPPRHLHPVEPPYDPEYDTPPPSRVPSNDRQAEAALLHVLTTDPATATRIADQLDPDDFYRPEHEAIWTAWHTLHARDGVPPDPITLNHHLTATRQPLATRALLDITTTPASPVLVDQYVRIVRDHARIRAAHTAVLKLTQQLDNARPGNLDTAFGDAVDTITDAALRFGPTTTTAATGLKDLSWILGGHAPEIPPPTILTRTDGTALFYAGKVNGIFGDPECGKSWLAQAAGIEALNTGGTLAIIDVDHNGPDHTAARLLLLGARPEHVANPDHVRYYEPEEPEELRAAVADVVAWAPTVVIIDSLGEVFPMLGINTNDGDEMTTALREVCSAPAAAGSCVITIDHLPKGTDARATGYAIGSIAKKRMIRGSYLRAEARTQPAPGAIGRITLRIEKDTAGELRKSSNGGYAGTFTIDSSLILPTGATATTWHVGLETAPKNDDGTLRPTVLMERVSKFVEDNDQCTSNKITAAVQGKKKAVTDAIQILTTEGYISRIPGRNNAFLHHSNAPYRESEDSHVDATN